MTNESPQTIDSDAIAVVVEMGDDFTPGPRTTAELAELLAALHEGHGPETEGFTFEPLASIRNFAFVSPGANGAIGKAKFNEIEIKK